MTDFRFDKKTGEVTQVGEANDDPDRIVKTKQFGKHKGEVKTNRKGEAKVAVDGIEKGILTDGQNWKTEDQVIDVGGEGQPSLDGVEDFVTNLSNHIGVEIAGAYLSSESGADANISKVYIDEYAGNKQRSAGLTMSKLITEPGLSGFNPITNFHSHLSNLNGVSRSDVENPSGLTDGKGDIGYRNTHRNLFTNFIILTRTTTYPTKVQKIDYTNY